MGMTVARAFVLGVVTLASLHAAAQNYPVKPIRIVVPFPAGGPTDLLARLVAQRLVEAWGQQVLIDNRPGGGGIIGGQIAAKSAADGYNVYLGGVTTLVVSTYTHKNRPYDDLRDFLPITLATMQPLLLMTHPSVPAKTLREFIALAKRLPGDINYGTSGPGGSGHLAGELLQGMAKIKIVHVPYRGQPPAMNDLIAGQVQSLFGSPLAMVPHIRAGKVRALAITGDKRSKAVPEVPTFAEAGLPGFDAGTWNGFMVPTGTPRAIVDKLNTEIVKILRAPNTLERLAADGSIAIGNTPEEYAAFLKAEHAKWSKVVREANIRVE